MKNRRIVFGYILIITGILLPLYGFFGLSRGIVLDKREYRKFMESEVDPKLEDKVEGYNNSIGKESVIVDPFATEEYISNYSFMEDPDAIFCYLKIPKLDLVQPVYMDASNKHMAMGVAHIEGTDLPGVKKGIRSVIAGHRGYYDAIMFLHLDELFEGDKIYLEWHTIFLRNYVFRKCIFNSVSTDGKIVRFIRSNTNIPRRINTNVCCRSISYSLCKCSFRNTYGKNNSINEKDKMK